VWLIYPSGPEEIKKSLKERSRAKALSFVAVPGDVHQISKQALSFNQVSSCLEKVWKDYNQLEEKPLIFSVK